MIDDGYVRIPTYDEYKKMAFRPEIKDNLKRVKDVSWGSEFNKSPKVKKITPIKKPTPPTLETILKKEDELWNS